MEKTTRVDNTLSQIWRKAFAQWPADFRRKGVVVPSCGEAIPFVDFVLNEDMLVLERATPDTVGSRRVAIPFLLIEGLKYTEPLKTEQFLKNGFVQRSTIPATTAPHVTPAQQSGAAGSVPADPFLQAAVESTAGT